MKKNYYKFYTLFFLLLGGVGVEAQLFYTENFDSGTGGWITQAIGGTWFPSATSACDGSSIRKNIFSTFTEGRMRSPLLATAVTAVPHSVTFDYKVVEWPNPTVSTPSSEVNIVIQQSTNGTTWVPIDTIDASNHVSSSVCATKTYTFTPTAGNLYVGFQCNWSVGDYYVYFDNIRIETVPSCPRPTQLTATNLTSSSTVIGWTTGGATNWNIEYGPAGFTQGTGTLDTNVTNPDTLLNLLPNTTYDVYVQDSCSATDVSGWNTITFTTLPTAHPVPLTDNFENANMLYFENESSSNAPWVLTSTLAHSTTQCFFNAYQNNNENILEESGVLDLSNIATPYLEFWHIAKTEGSWDRCFVEISTDGGVTYSAIPSSAYRGSGGYPGNFWEDSYAQWGTLAETPDNSWWKQEFFDLSNYKVPNVRIRFRLTSDGSATRAGWYVDDVRVYDLTCPRPTQLAATNITSSSADIGWTTGGAANWNIEYGPAGFTQGTGTLDTNITNPFTLSNLLQNTVYDVYVQDSCGAGDVSNWVMINLTTLPTAHPVPLIDSFENSNMLYFENESSSNAPWVLTTTLAHSDTQCFFNAYQNNNENILEESGVLDLSNTTVPYLEFWHIAKTEGGWDRCFVEISTDGGVTYSAIPSSAYRGSGGYLGNFWEDSYAQWGTGFETPDNSWWKKELFDLRNYKVPNVRLRFRLTSDFSGTRTGWYVDDVRVFAPTCPIPFNFVASSTNEDSVFLSWTAGSQETAWNIEYGLLGFTQGSGTVVATSDTTIDTISGLSLGSVYEFYIQADCGGGDESSWVGPITVATPITNDATCDAIALTPNTDYSSRYFSNIGATTQQNESLLPGTQENTAWFKTVIPASGHLLIATCFSDFNTVVGVYGYDTLICDSIETYGELAYNAGNFQLCGVFSRGSVEICGATPGDSVLFYVGGSNSSQSGIIDLIVTDYTMEGYAGEGDQQPVDVCAGDSVNLWNHLSNNLVDFGNWSYPLNPGVIIDDTIANTGAFTLSGNEVYYVVNNTCDEDTAVVTFNAMIEANSGVALDTFTQCNAGDVFLFDGLTGAIDAGGTWNDDTGVGNLLVGSKFIATDLPLGTYQFTYTVDNGICPASSTQIGVELVDCTDIEEGESSTFGIYPNPNNGNFFIVNGQLDSDVVVEVVDMQGKLIYNNQYRLNSGTQQEVSLDDVESGVYMVKIVTNNQVFNANVIVK